MRVKRLHSSLISLLAAALLAASCTETKTPTEVPAFVAPTPAPTPVPQPASMSGLVLGYYGGRPNEGATVECQGKSTITGIGGAYVLPGLLSGTSPVIVRWKEQGEDTYQNFLVVLMPGTNLLDFRTGP